MKEEVKRRTKRIVGWSDVALVLLDLATERK